jgi:hypothetical protein
MANRIVLNAVELGRRRFDAGEFLCLHKDHLWISHGAAASNPVRPGCSTPLLSGFIASGTPEAMKSIALTDGFRA